MEPSKFLPTKFPTFTSIDTQSAVPSIEYVYQALQRALPEAQLAHSVDCKYTRNQGNKFSTTVDVTLKLSLDGIILARDALTFFAAFENGHDDKALTDYLEGLHKIAESSLDKARQCYQQFSDNFELIGELGFKPIKNPVYSPGKELEVEKSHLIELLSSGCTSWCLSLPFIVPPLIKRGKNQAKSEAVRPNNITPNYTREQLEVELDNVRTYLSHLVAWWLDTVNKLCQMRDILKCPGNSLRQDTFALGLYQQTWTSIKREHSTYREQVSMIQDVYPQFQTFEDTEVRYRRK